MHGGLCTIKKLRMLINTIGAHEKWYCDYKRIEKPNAFYMIPLVANIACNHWR